MSKINQSVKKVFCLWQNYFFEFTLGKNRLASLPPLGGRAPCGQPISLPTEALLQRVPASLRRAKPALRI